MTRTWVETVMGLPVSVRVRGGGPAAPRAVAAVLGDLHRADRVFSTWRADSEVGLLRAGALAPELASPAVRVVRELCARARQETGGWFDADLPGADGVRRWDPTGLVKGWAVEQATAALAGLDGVDWLVNAGGDVVGRATTGPAWRVAVEDPRDRSRLVAVVALTDGAVATSGTAARGAHLLDPRTGRPAAPDLLSATVVGPSLTVADVHATAAYVQGPGSLARIAGLPGYEALLVHPDGSLTGTPGMRALLAGARAA